MTLAKKRIKSVFDEAMERIESGQEPNIQQLMLKHGYSEYSARAGKVKDTKTWKQLMAELDDSMVAEGFAELAFFQEEDKRTKLNALKEIAKLKDLYPASKSKIDIGLQERSRFLEEPIIEDAN